MAENADPTVRAIAGHLSRALGTPVHFITGPSWQEREAMLDRGLIDLCWICGLPYALKAAAGGAPIELCAAPVMEGARYAGLPVYYSDVVVRRDSCFRSFADLRGASCAYNEPGSHSGYNAIRHHLARLDAHAGYFSRAVESGAHQISLEMILRGEVDAAAIDTTVLEAELRRRPALAGEIRVVETLGPSAMPPWVLRSTLPAKTKSAIGAALLAMQDTREGRAILAGWGIAGFVRVGPEGYDALRRMAEEAGRVQLAA
jgi:phosphonate transport system substrate-binding protein